MYSVIYITNKFAVLLLKPDKRKLTIYAQCNCKYVQHFKEAYKEDFTQGQWARFFVRLIK